MQTSVANTTRIKELLQSELTDIINDRETFMKGIDYSYYCEHLFRLDLLIERFFCIVLMNVFYLRLLVSFALNFPNELSISSLNS